MTRVLLIVTIVMSLAAAALSFRTKQQAEDLLEEKRQAVADAQKQKAEVAKLSAAQKDAEAKIEEFSKSKGTLVEESTKAREDLKTREAELAKLKEETSEKLAEMVKLQERLKTAEEKMANPPAPVANAEAEAKLSELGSQLQRSQQAALQLEKNAQSLAMQVEDLKKKVEQEKKRADKAELKKKESFVFGASPDSSGDSKTSAARVDKSFAGDKKVAAASKASPEPDKSAGDDEESTRLKLQEKLRSSQGQVVSYDPGWNLVVVNLGDADGVTMESSMQVRRAGQVVANLRIAKVDAKQFTATVLPPEGKRKADVLRGDAVVLAIRGPS